MEKSIRINLIYLAAGYARRFGVNKLLYELDGQPLFTYGISAVLELKRLLEYSSPVQEDTGIQIDAFPLVVTAYDEIELWCEKHGVSCIRNNPPKNTGMASSIQKAITFCEMQELCGTEKGMQTDIAGNICAPCYDMYFTADQPNLDAKVLARFVCSFLEQECSIGSMEYDGMLHSPNIFSAEWRSEFLKLTGETGGKKILREHPDELYCHPVKQGGMFADIDTPNDIYKRA